MPRCPDCGEVHETGLSGMLCDIAMADACGCGGSTSHRLCRYRHKDQHHSQSSPCTRAISWRAYLRDEHVGSTEPSENKGDG